MSNKELELDENESERTADGTENSFKIGQLAAMFGITTRTIRFYEEMGLIAPIDRLEGSHRRYGPRALIHLKRIQQLKDYELSLSEIGSLFELSRSDRSGTLVRGELIQMYRDKLDGATRRKEALERQIDELAWHIDQLTRVSDFFECPGAACESCAWRSRCDLSAEDA